MSADEFDITFADGFVTPGRRRNKLDATTAPTVNDDAGDGYEVNSVWIDTTNDNVYICTDPTATAANWEQVNGAGATDHGTLTGLDDGDHDTLNTDLTVTGAHTIDRADGATHDLTLTGNATFTLSGAFTGKSTDLRLILRQDGTGSRTVTWPAITWAGGSAPTLQTAANAVDTIGLLSVDAGSTWFGYYDLTGSDVEVTAATVKAVGRWEPVQYDDGSSPWPFVYFNDEIVVAWVDT